MVALALLVLSTFVACGSSDKKAGSSSTTTIPGVSVAGSTTLPSSTTSTSVLLPTTSLPSCQALPVPAQPISSVAPAQAVLLTKVDELGDNCVDHVVFSFRSKGPNPPGYTVSYASPPFSSDGSGKPLPVKGSAFISVRLSPAYGFDFESGQSTYTGPDRITPHAKYVTEIVKAGDFEGVVTWIIGLSSKRGMSVQATGKPQTQLVVTVG
jgi:hypothetical protein